MQPHQAIPPVGDGVVENIRKIASATFRPRKAGRVCGKAPTCPQLHSHPHDCAHRLWIMGINGTTQRSQAVPAGQAVGIFGTNA